MSTRPDKVFVSNIKDNDKIDSYFLVKDKNIAVAKNGKPYVIIKLMDKTGEIEGRVWDNAEETSRQFEKNDIIRIKGRGVNYQGKIQLSVNDVTKLPFDEFNLQDFLPKTKLDPDEMFSELVNIVSQITDVHLRLLLESFLQDRAFIVNLKTAPAAKGMHHVYIGGLLEHLLSVSCIAVDISRHYEGIDRDMLIAGAILHDIGKTRELSYGSSFDYTDEGRLLGHILIGIQMVDEKIRGIDGFPENKALLIRHMIAAHHGELEFGSPKRPKTIEGVILHHIEDMDAKVNAFQTAVMKESTDGSRWTPYQKMFDRYLYRGE